MLHCTHAGDRSAAERTRLCVSEQNAQVGYQHGLRLNWTLRETFKEALFLQFKELHLGTFTDQ